jgi:CheY-specific phosphatase CheX
MAERYDVVIDFAQYRIGQRVVLRNLGGPNAQEQFNDRVMAFGVVSEPTNTVNNEVAAVLNPNPPAFDLDPPMATRTRRFEFIRQAGEWTTVINNHGNPGPTPHSPPVRNTRLATDAGREGPLP